MDTLGIAHKVLYDLKYFILFTMYFPITFMNKYALNNNVSTLS